MLYDGRGDSHIGEQVEKCDDYGGDSYDSEVVRGKQACQYSGYYEGDDDAAVFG